MRSPFLDISGKRIPRILLGTSPFIGAGQFGARSRIYFSKFYLNPKNIVKIIDRCVELGVIGIQALPEEPIIWAIREALKKYEEIIVVPSIISVRDIELMQEFECPLMLIHGAITNSRKVRMLEELLDRIRETGSLAGLVTHTPITTMKWLINKNLKYEALMLPVNKIGYMIDGTLDAMKHLVSKLGKHIIAKKVLAAGRIPVKEAIEFVSKLPFIDVIALGVASEEEAIETFTIAKQLFLKQP